MKSTVKLAPLLGLVMKPSPNGFGVSFSVERDGKTDFHVDLTPDECGALIFGLQCASDARAQAVRHDSTATAFADRLAAAAAR